MIALRDRSAPGFALRLYQPSDLQAIVDLDRICFSEAFRFTKRTMRGFAEASNSISVVASRDGTAKIVGFIIIHLVVADQDIHAYVVTLDVHPGSGRSGVGSALLSAAGDLAAEAGAIRIDLHVHTENIGAVGFYIARNFKQEGQLEDFYWPGRNAFLYRKHLCN